MHTGGTLPEGILRLLSPEYSYLRNTAVVEQIQISTQEGLAQSVNGIFDVNGGRGNNARFRINVHVTGRYHIEVEGRSSSDLGTYTVFVTTTQ